MRALLFGISWPNLFRSSSSALFAMASAIISEAALTFLGLQRAARNPDLGWHPCERPDLYHRIRGLALFPGCFFAVLGINPLWRRLARLARSTPEALWIGIG